MFLKCLSWPQTAELPKVEAWLVRHTHWVPIEFMLFTMILKHLVIDFEVLVCCPLYQLDGWVMKKRNGLSILLDIHWFVRLMSGWFINTSHSSWSCSETFLMRWYLLHTRWHNRRSKRSYRGIHQMSIQHKKSFKQITTQMHEQSDRAFTSMLTMLWIISFFSASLTKKSHGGNILDLAHRSTIL